MNITLASPPAGATPVFSGTTTNTMLSLSGAFYPRATCLRAARELVEAIFGDSEGEIWKRSPTESLGNPRE